jgi:hypothetical protein
MVLLFRGGIGSADCADGDWKRRNNRENVNCGGPDTIAPEIASQVYLDAFDRLGVKYAVRGGGGRLTARTWVRKAAFVSLRHTAPPPLLPTPPRR